MVPRFVRPGQSFKGVIAYLTHDPDKAETAKRIGWTHTLNLANDHVPSAVNEMLWTFRHAELLKAETGAHQGGSKVAKPVKHFSLNWDPSEKPGKAEMIEAAASFLRHMGWHEHQCILVAHTDREHPHVHAVVNAIHPVTGLKLNDGFERRRAQAWALAYEQSRGTIFCPQRQWQAAERESAMPRPAWMAAKDHTKQEVEAEEVRAAKVQPAFGVGYFSQIENRRIIERREWEILKDVQKEERLSFFAEGKAIYGALNRAAYREVREEFRADWADYYAAKRGGLAFEVLAETRTALIARQKQVLDERREFATREVWVSRDKAYRALLDAQKEQRAELIGRQERGLSSPRLLDRAHPAEGSREAGNRSRVGVGTVNITSTNVSDPLNRFGIRRGRKQPAAATEAGTMTAGSRRAQAKAPIAASPLAPRFTPAASAPSRDIASGLAGGLFAILGGIGESMIGGHTKADRSAELSPEARDPLDRFGVRWGRSGADEGKERAERDKRQAYDDEWYAWRRRARDR